MALAPRVVALVGLLALAPVVAYGLFRPSTIAAAVTAVNVTLIVASIVVAMRATRANGHAH